MGKERELSPLAKEFLEIIYKLTGRQFTVVMRIDTFELGYKGFIQASFFYPRSDRVAMDREEQRKIKAHLAKTDVPGMVAP